MNNPRGRRARIRLRAAQVLIVAGLLTFALPGWSLAAEIPNPAAESPAQEMKSDSAPAGEGSSDAVQNRAVRPLKDERQYVVPIPQKLQKDFPPLSRQVALSVVTTNIANAFTLEGITWQQKMDRLTTFLVSSGSMPDIISMTESSGWTWCLSPISESSGDYDMVDRLIFNLRNSTGITYRVAYLVGAEGSFGLGRCRYYSGDTLLYNPNRLSNLTPGDVAPQPQVAHNSDLSGFLVRRSLPLCNRGTHLMALEQLIDGPPQIDKCNRATPSGPAWVQVYKFPDGGQATIATLARFALNGVPGSSFDVVTTHPTSTFEPLLQTPINNFISALTGPPYRTTRPYYPLVVLGDFNTLADPANLGGAAWPVGTTQVFKAPEDVMVVALGGSAGPLPPLHSLNTSFTMKLPNETPCRFYPDRSFSDHCGLVVRFTE
jgi:hypothetical protein